MTKNELTEAIRKGLPLQVRHVDGGYVDMHQRDPLSIDPKYIQVKPPTGGGSMNEISIYDKPGRCELTVRIGDRFQSVSIKKTVNRVDIASSLRRWADNIEHDKLMGGEVPANINESTCRICAAFKYTHESTGRGWCYIHKITISGNHATCKEFGI